MGYYVTDPALVAQFNAGLPPDECAGSYYQMDQREIEREEVRRKRWESDQRLREYYQEREWWKQRRGY